jgi:hypothetical protein
VDHALNDLIERFDGAHAVRFGDVGRAAVRLLAPHNDQELKVISHWDAQTMAKERPRLLEEWWGRFDRLSGKDRERCRLFLLMIRDDENHHLDGYDVGMIYDIMLTAGLTDAEAKTVFSGVLA